MKREEGNTKREEKNDCADDHIKNTTYVFS